MERLTAKSSPLILCRALYTSLWGERPMTASKSKWSSKVNSCGCITLGVRRMRAAAVAINTCAIYNVWVFALFDVSRVNPQASIWADTQNSILPQPHSIVATMRSLTAVSVPSSCLISP